ncbi:MAG: hypothetical protein WC242_05415 [Candidatus Paceibacterota bacterium]|jgi:CheY-like chemotaxis protein
MAEILVVTGEAFYLKTLLEVLEEQEGLRTRTARSGVEALEHLKSGRAEEKMVCTDLSFNIGDVSLVHEDEKHLVRNGFAAGVVLLRRIKEWRSDFPVVLLTSWREGSPPRVLAEPEKFDGAVLFRGELYDMVAEIKALWDKLVLKNHK